MTVDRCPGRYQVEVPLPPKAVSSNWRGHWARRRKAVKSYREACYLCYYRLMMHGKIPTRLPVPVTVHLDFYLCNKSPVPGMTLGEYAGVCLPRDADNARHCFKAGQDALADIGLVPGDGHKNVICGETRIHSRAKEHGGRSCVVVTLECGREALGVEEEG